MRFHSSSQQSPYNLLTNAIGLSRESKPSRKICDGVTSERLRLNNVAELAKFVVFKTGILYCGVTLVCKYTHF